MIVIGYKPNIANGMKPYKGDYKDAIWPEGAEPPRVTLDELLALDDQLEAAEIKAAKIEAERLQPA